MQNDNSNSVIESLLIDNPYEGHQEEEDLPVVLTIHNVQ